MENPTGMNVNTRIRICVLLIAAFLFIAGCTKRITDSNTDDTRVKTFVEGAKAYAQKNGNEHAMIAINRQDGDFVKNDLSDIRQLFFQE